jgi:hypothetical protein
MTLGITTLVIMIHGMMTRSIIRKSMTALGIMSQVITALGMTALVILSRSIMTQHNDNHNNDISIMTISIMAYQHNDN